MATKDDRARIEIEYEDLLRREGKFPGPYEKEHQILKNIEMKGAVGACAIFGLSVFGARYTKSRVLIPVGLLGSVCYMHVYSAVYAVLSFSRVCESDRSKIAEVSCPELLKAHNSLIAQNPQQTPRNWASSQVTSCLNYYKRKQELGQLPNFPIVPAELNATQPVAWNSSSSSSSPSLPILRRPDSPNNRGEWQGGITQPSSSSSWSTSNLSGGNLSATPEFDASSASSFSSSSSPLRPAPSLSGGGDSLLNSAPSGGDGLLRDRRHRRLTPQSTADVRHQEQQPEESEVYLEETFNKPPSKPTPTGDDAQIAKWQEMYQKRKNRRHSADEPIS